MVLKKIFSLLILLIMVSPICYAITANANLQTLQCDVVETIFHSKYKTIENSGNQNTLYFYIDSNNQKAYTQKKIEILNTVFEKDRIFLGLFIKETSEAKNLKQMIAIDRFSGNVYIKTTMYAPEIKSDILVKQVGKCQPISSIPNL